MTGKRMTKENVLDVFQSVHGKRYDYSKVEYVNSETHVLIGCSEHGFFLQRPHIHAQGSGCQLCGNKLKPGQKPLSLTEMLSRAVKVHGEGHYDYSLITNYTTQKTKHSIKCNKCSSVFQQSLYKHVNRKQGCPHCAVSGFSSSVDGYVYLLESETMFKVGISNRNISNRVREVNRNSPEKFKQLYSIETTGDICRTLEESLITECLKYFCKVSESFHGSTECFHKQENFERAKQLFLDLSKTVDKLDTFVPKSRRKPKGIPRDIAKARERLEQKRGIPVGVQYAQGLWRFSINIRMQDKKRKYKSKTLGTFSTRENCITFAKHYWHTGEVLDTNTNRMFYKDDGLPVGISRNGPYFKVCHAWRTRQFKDRDDALLYLNMLRIQYG